MKSSIKLKLGIAIIILTCIYFGSVTVLFVSLYSALQNRIIESYQSSLEVLKQHELTEFQETDQFINTLSRSFDINMLPLMDPGSAEYILQIYKIRQNICTHFYNYTLLNSLYIYDASENKMIYIPDDSGKYQEFIYDFIDSNVPDNGWYERRLASTGETIYMRTCRISKNQWIFAFVKAAHIATLLERIAKENDLAYSIVNANGAILYKSKELDQERHSYEMIQENLSFDTISLNLNFFMKKVLLWKQAKIYTLFLLGNIILFILHIVFIVRYTRNRMLRAIQVLLEGMKIFANGDEMVQVQAKKDFEPELQYAIDSFNQMVNQIRRNKFLIYQSEIEHQKLLLQNMQSQINPHFFSNTTNLIYNLIRIGNTKTAEKCVLLLSSYYRSMTNIGCDTIPLEQELDLINSYLGIMKLRFPNKLTFEVLIETDLKSLEISPLLIQPLAENCIKHGFIDRKKTFHICIQIFRQGRMNCIEVIDNGGGFPEKYRGIFNQDRGIPDDVSDTARSHVGIQNIFQRLMMLYQAETSMQIEWNGYQTTVRILIPIQKPDSDLPEAEK